MAERRLTEVDQGFDAALVRREKREEKRERERESFFFNPLAANFQTKSNSKFSPTSGAPCPLRA